MSISAEQREQILERARQRESAPSPAPAASPASPTTSQKSDKPFVRATGGAEIRVIDKDNPPTEVRRRGNVVARPAGGATQGPRTMGARVVNPEAPGPRVRPAPRAGAYGATVVPNAKVPEARTSGPSATSATPIAPALAAQIQAMGQTQSHTGTAAAPQPAALADLTVVLSQHVRPGALEQQYRALLASGVVPQNIRCWVNPAGVRLNDGLLGRILHVRASHDLGPWMRWSFAVNVPTKYVAIIDDDCIPGPLWLSSAIAKLEAAAAHESVQPFVVAAAGAVYEQDDPESARFHGPESLDRHDVLVDTGRGAWVMKASHARTIDTFPRLGSPLATPIHVAAALSAEGIQTVVLPYPHNQRDVWGMLTPPQADTSMSSRLDRAHANGQSPSAAELRREDYAVYREVAEWEPLCLQGDEASKEETP